MLTPPRPANSTQVSQEPRAPTTEWGLQGTPALLKLFPRHRTGGERAAHSCRVDYMRQSAGPVPYTPGSQ